MDDRKAIADWEREFRKRRGLGANDPVPLSLPSPTYAGEARARKVPAPRAGSLAATPNVRISGPANEKYVLVDGKYRLNPNYAPGYDIPLGHAIGIPALLGAAAALLPPATLAGLGIGGARLAKGGKSGARLQGSYPPRMVQALNKFYPARGMGEHVAPRRYAEKFPILAPVINHPANVLRRPTKGEMYELHFRCDQNFKGARLPGGLEESGWSGARAGLKKNGPLRWMWECTTPAMKAAAGVAAAGGGAAAVGTTKDKEPRARAQR